MKNYKKWFWTSVLLMIGWFSSFGCVTKAVWEDGYISSPYHELILSFYTNKKSKNIAFIGKEFHYIFDKQTDEFIKLLNSKDLLNLQQENLQINSSAGRPIASDVYANILVNFNINKLTTPQKSWLIAHNYNEHFIPNKREEIKVYSKYYQIKGKRFLANSKVNAKVKKLKRAIPLTIMAYKKEKGNLAKKIALTPLSITADAVGGAVLLVGAMIYIPIDFIGSLFD